MKTSWSVTVLYENEAKRAEAKRFCNQLAERFCAGAELALNWRSFQQLGDPSSSEEAVAKATEADVVVLALHPETAIPLEVDFWMENWLGRRGQREGMLVGLLGASTSPEVAEKHRRLRKMACRGGMDYLTRLPEYAAQLISDSFESYYDRMHRMTNVMDDILHHAPTPHLLT
jgi:hypothetical protein